MTDSDDKPKRGRPSKFTVEIAAEIAQRLSTGEPLAKICRDEHMPDRTTVWDWTNSDPAFSQLVAHARAQGLDALAAQCLEISDTPQEGVTLVTKEDGKVEERRGDMIGHRKLQIETRLKLLAIWDPKRFGSKVALTGGSPDDAPIRSEQKISLAPEQLAQAVEALKGAF